MNKNIFKRISCVLFAVIMAIGATISVSAAESYLWPTANQNRISQYYRSGHTALDIAGSGNIVATKSGKVEYLYTGCTNFSGAKKGIGCTNSTCSPNAGFYYSSYYKLNFCNYAYGNGVIIRHSDGSGISLYGHMSEIYVKVGDTVKQGQAIGKMGSTGASEGVHLHFALYKDGSRSSVSGHFNTSGPIMSNPIEKSSNGIAYIYSVPTNTPSPEENGGEGSGETETNTPPETKAPTAKFTVVADSEIMFEENMIVSVKVEADANIDQLDYLLYDASGSLLTVKNGPKLRTNSVTTTLNVNDTLGYTLVPDTAYSYALSVKMGDHTVTSERFAFTTLQNPKTYTLTFMPTGGILYSNQTIQYTNSKFENLPRAEKYGYDFLGWSTVNGGKVDVVEGEKVPFEGAITVYACWQKTRSDSSIVYDGERYFWDKSIPLPFADILAEDWYYDSVNFTYQIGVINGKSEQSFEPHSNMTRAEAIKLAVCLQQIFKYGKTLDMNPSEPWYDSYVLYAEKNGIYCSYHNFEEAVTREQFVKIMHSAFPLDQHQIINIIVPGAIPDVSDSSNAYREIYDFYGFGILAGSDAFGSFRPESNISRAEAVAILTRMFDKSQRKSFSLITSDSFGF